MQRLYAAHLEVVGVASTFPAFWHNTLFSRAQCPEVLCSLRGSVHEQSHDDAPHRLASNGHIKEDLQYQRRLLPAAIVSRGLPQTTICNAALGDMGLNKRGWWLAFGMLALACSPCSLRASAEAAAAWPSCAARMAAGSYLMPEIHPPVAGDVGISQCQAKGQVQMQLLIR